MEAKLLGGPYLGGREEYCMQGQEKLSAVFHKI